MNPAPSATLEEQIGQIADEFLSCLQRGESPTVEEYVAANWKPHRRLAHVLPLVRASHRPTERSQKRREFPSGSATTASSARSAGAAWGSSTRRCRNRSAGAWR